MYITKAVANLMQFTLIAYTVKPALLTTSIKLVKPALVTTSIKQ